MLVFVSSVFRLWDLTSIHPQFFGTTSNFGVGANWVVSDISPVPRHPAVTRLSFPGKPPDKRAWLAQGALYVLLMLCEKALSTLVVQLPFWDQVRLFIMSPIHNPKVEVALVVLVIPFFVNVSLPLALCAHSLTQSVSQSIVYLFFLE
ncbi:hypothetical protein ISCGN_004204 [Ixodes scapularis]